jgi:hypothetical protein
MRAEFMKRSRIVVVAIGLVCAIVLAACGGGEPEGTPSTSSPEATTDTGSPGGETEEAPEPEPEEAPESEEEEEEAAGEDVSLENVDAVDVDALDIPEHEKIDEIYEMLPDDIKEAGTIISANPGAFPPYYFTDGTVGVSNVVADEIAKILGVSTSTSRSRTSAA